MELRYSSTEKDYENAALSLERVRRSLPGQWRVWTIFQWCMSFVPLFFIGADLVFMGAALADTPVWLLGWVFMGLSIGIALAAWEVPRLQLKNQFRTSPFIAAERILTIDDRGISVVLPNCMFRYEWEAFTRYRETQFTFPLLTSSYDGLAWIPKRVMSPPQIEELRQRLKARLLAC